MRGFSERVARQELERRGLVVWRGGFAHANRSDQYPNVTRKYARLERVVRDHYPGRLELLQYLSSSQRGMPDLAVWNGRELRFVEVKLDYEPLSERQKRCLKRLCEAGFTVSIMRVVSSATRTRESVIDLDTFEERAITRQLRLDDRSRT